MESFFDGYITPLPIGLMSLSLSLNNQYNGKYPAGFFSWLGKTLVDLACGVRNFELGNEMSRTALKVKLLDLRARTYTPEN